MIRRLTVCCRSTILRRRSTVITTHSVITFRLCLRPSFKLAQIDAPLLDASADSRSFSTLILRQQPGFLDETVLTSDMESNRVLALSFWKTKEDAERYNKEHFSKINDMISHLVETAPVVRTFNVPPQLRTRSQPAKPPKLLRVRKRLKGEPLGSPFFNLPANPQRTPGSFLHIEPAYT
jgi:heme-degrading monooxygenase HmoA